MKALPNGTQCFAHTQALWRFLANERTTPEVLAGPVIAGAQAAVGQTCAQYALVVHDWSRLNYRRHPSKSDRHQMTHETDVGYELQSSLLLSDTGGDPLGCVAQNLVTQEGVWSTQWQGCAAPAAHLDELSARMGKLEHHGFGKPLVHVVDREADSVAHLRQWSAAQQRWLVRAKAARCVRHEDKNTTLAQVGAAVPYTLARRVEHQGQAAQQWIGSTVVSLTRPARPKRLADGKRVAPIHGAALQVRLIVSRIENAAGETLAIWYLLSNVEHTVADERVALWYYWRWRIESYFKLLKGAGHQLERWEQESGLGILKRILIASHACALSWQLLRAQDPIGQQTAAFLVRLSGRQMKRTQPITAPALLVGLYQLFAMLEVLDHHSIDQLKAYARTAFPHYSQLRR